LRDGFPHGFLFAALEGVDEGRTRDAIFLTAEAIPVIHIQQPVHAVQIR